MANPFDYYGGGSSYAAMFGPPRQLTARELLPPIDPETERADAGWMLEDALGGLGYIGSVLDKTFGGRAVRGVLGGKPEELLSVLPFSDTLGITDQRNEVSGRDLLSDVGLTSRRRPDEPFNWEDDILGMGAEIALDPSTYLSLGTTAAGKLAAKSGALAKGFIPQLKAGQRGLTFHMPLSGTLTGTEGLAADILSGPQVLNAASWARSGATLPTRGIDYGLNAIAGVTPLQGLQRRAYDNLLEPGLRMANEWLDPAVKGARTAIGQDVGRGLDAGERGLERQALSDLASRYLRYKEFAKRAGIDLTQPGAEEAYRRAIAYKIENTVDDPADLLEGFQKKALDETYAEMQKYHTPLSDPGELENMRDWYNDPSIGLSQFNQNIYDQAVKPFDRMLIEDRIPGLGRFPDDPQSLTLLDALRDRVNTGGTLGQGPAGFELIPSGGEITEARKTLAQNLRNDPLHGINPNLMNNAQIDAYNKLLDDWVANPALGPNALQGGPFTTGRDPLQALQSTGSKLPEYNRALGKAEIYTPPLGTTKDPAWIAANIQPQDLPAFEALVDADKKALATFKAVEEATGAKGGWFTDSFIDYLTRHQQKYPAGDPRAATSKAAAEWAKTIKASNESFESRLDIFRNVPGGTATINDLATDPRFSGPNRTITNPDSVRAAIRETLTGTDQPAKGNPAWKQAEGLEKWLAQLPAEHAEKSVPFFGADLPQLIFGRQRGANKVKAIGDAFYDAFKRFGDNAAGWSTRGQTDLVSARDLAMQMNLSGADDAGSIATQTLAQKAGLPPLQQGQKYKLDDLKDLYLPKDVADDMLKFNQAMTTPKVLEPVIKAWDAASALTKSYLTRPFPSFHSRNSMSGLFNTWRSGAGLSTETMKQTWEFLRGRGDNILPGVSKDELWKELVANRIAFNPNNTLNADILGNAGEIVSQGIRKPVESTGTAARDVLNRVKDEVKNPTLNPLNKDNSLLALATDAGNQIEDFIRVNNYLGLRKQGYTAEAAAEQVMKYQIDYSRLTGVERAGFKRILPWYSFSKGTLPVVLEDLVAQPSVITGPVRAVTGGRPQGEFVPSYIGEGAALPLGQNDDGSQRYLTSFGLPIEDESFKTLGSLLKGDLTRAGEQTLGQAFPWIKSPLELLFNKQLYSGRPLTDLKPYEFADLGGLLNEKQARVLTEIAANTPASRTLGTVNRFTDPRKDVVDQLLGLGTGAKITDVDLERAYNSAITSVLGDTLKGAPGVRTREEVYVPTANIPNLTPEDARRYALYVAAEQRLRESAAKKKKESATSGR